MESRNNKKCVICKKRQVRGSNLFLSRFPLDSDRCRMWVRNVGIEDLAYVPIEKLHQLKYVCGSHFTSESFNSKGTRLKKTAIPTLELSNPFLPDHILKEFPLHVKDTNKENLKTVFHDHSYIKLKKSNPVARAPLTNLNVAQPSPTSLETVNVPVSDSGITAEKTAEYFVPLPSTSNAPQHMTYKTITVPPLTNLNVAQPSPTSLETVNVPVSDSGITAEKTVEYFVPLPSTSNAPQHMTFKTITVEDKNTVHQEAKADTLVHSYKRHKQNIETKDTSRTLSIREKRLWRQLQNAKKTIKNLAKSRLNLDKLDSEVLTSLVKDVSHNQKKKPQGKRWTLNNKIYALAIFKRSPKAYRYMQKLFTLPSVKTLQRLLKDIPMEPGINQNIINVLEAKANTMSQDNKYCCLLFDEMALKKRVIYNEISDKVDGYVDYGVGENMGRENKHADHVLVFMIQGLKYKFKQYIAHYFVQGTVSTERLAKIITSVIKKLKEIGFIVVTTVSDQGSTNIGALNLLKKNCGQDTDSNFFNLGNEKIYIIYDIPHLFKSIRNNFYKSGRMSYDGKIAVWNHLVAAEQHNRSFFKFY